MSYGGEGKYIQSFVWKSEAITSPRRILQDSVKMDLTEHDGRAWIGLVWFRVGTSCGLL